MCSDRLARLKVEIEEKQVAAREKHFPAAFITFTSRFSQVGVGDALPGQYNARSTCDCPFFHALDQTKQVAASRSLMTEDLSTWRCQPAPKPEEVIWTNLGWRDWERAGRRMVMLCAFIAMTLFFMIPVAAVQAILSTNSLVRYTSKLGT